MPVRACFLSSGIKSRRINTPHYSVFRGQWLKPVPPGRDKEQHRYSQEAGLHCEHLLGVLKP